VAELLPPRFQKKQKKNFFYHFKNFKIYIFIYFLKKKFRQWRSLSPRGTQAGNSREQALNSPPAPPKLI